MSKIIKRDFYGKSVFQRESDGFFDLTAMCKSVGKQIGDYVRLQTTKDFVEALSRETKIPVEKLLQVSRGGSNKKVNMGNPILVKNTEPDKKNQYGNSDITQKYHHGTWGHPQVAINLAIWANPEFAVLVTKVVLDWMQSRTTTNIFLQKVLLNEPAKYQKTFPDEFFEALCNLYEEQYEVGKCTPSYFGHFINKYVYNHLFEGLSKELKERRSIYIKDNYDEKEMYKLHQFFEDNAKNDLRMHIAKLTTLIQVSYSKKHFNELFSKHFIQKDQLLLKFAQKH